MHSARFSYALALVAVFVPSILAGAIPKRDRPLAFEDDGYDADTVYSACYPGQEMCMKPHSWDTEEPWECVDTQKSVENCGGCTQPMQNAQPVGRDCTIIPGQRSVSCVRGNCIISKCQSGWKIAADGGACYELYDEGD